MKATFEMNPQMRKEMEKTIRVLWTVFMCLGGLILVLYAVGDLVYKSQTHEGSSPYKALLYYGVFMLVMGLIMNILMNKMNKKNDKINENTVANYEFFEEYFTVEDIKNGEVTANQKVYYKDLIKFKETKSYLFLYPMTVTAYPIEKSAVTDGTYEDIKNYLKAQNPKLKIK